MNPTALEKYFRKDGTGTLANRLEEPAPVDDLGCVGVLRGVRERSPSIELRRKTGQVLVVAYGWIETMEYDPTDGVLLRAGGKTIRIKGRNLGAELRPNLRLIGALAAHRVSWIQEIGGADLLLRGESLPAIEAIEWLRPE